MNIPQNPCLFVKLLVIGKTCRLKFQGIINPRKRTEKKLYIFIFKKNTFLDYSRIYFYI